MSWRTLWTWQTGQCYLAVGAAPCQREWQARGTIADELENAMDRADRAVLLGRGGGPLPKRVAGPEAL